MDELNVEHPVEQVLNNHTLFKHAKKKKHHAVESFGASIIYQGFSPSFIVGTENISPSHWRDDSRVVVFLTTAESTVVMVRRVQQS